ncbi:MAG TPA: NIPSNAP family protein [Candidatus Tectomicrobia bacterium]|nr:NIPSNAP family protein [Candidatus Tectomicrobia bacterium]
MIYELRTYTLAPGTQAKYIQLSAEVGRKARGDRYGTLEGHWYSEFGTLNQAVHLWSYPDLNERDRLRAELAKNEEWTKGYLPQTRGMIVAQENKILSAAVPLTPPTDSGNIYELRWYRTQVGKAAEWIGLFKGILPTREKYMRRVGVWTSEIGSLNEVVHMWVFKSLDERAAQRAKMAQDPEWQKFLAASTSLLVHMQATILNPSPHSPMR